MNQHARTDVRWERVADPLERPDGITQKGLRSTSNCAGMWIAGISTQMATPRDGHHISVQSVVPTTNLEWPGPGCVVNKKSFGGDFSSSVGMQFQVHGYAFWRPSDQLEGHGQITVREMVVDTLSMRP